jgi:hypothetical protein
MQQKERERDHNFIFLHNGKSILSFGITFLFFKLSIYESKLQEWKLNLYYDSVYEGIQNYTVPCRSYLSMNNITKYKQET